MQNLKLVPSMFGKVKIEKDEMLTFTKNKVLKKADKLLCI